MTQKKWISKHFVIKIPLVRLRGRYNVSTFFLNAKEDVEIPAYIISDSSPVESTYPWQTVEKKVINSSSAEVS